MPNLITNFETTQSIAAGILRSATPSMSQTSVIVKVSKYYATNKIRFQIGL